MVGGNASGKVSSRPPCCKSALLTQYSNCSFTSTESFVCGCMSVKAFVDFVFVFSILFFFDSV